MPEPTMTVEQIAAALRDLPRPSFRKRLKAALMERTAPMTTVIESQRAVAGRQTAAPRLRVKNAAAAIDFYTRAFGARELMRFEGHGRIAHAELDRKSTRLNSSHVSISYAVFCLKKKKAGDADRRRDRRVRDLFAGAMLDHGSSAVSRFAAPRQRDLLDLLTDRLLARRSTLSRAT